MASSSEKAPSPAAADLPERGKITVASGKPKGKTRRMTQEEIDSYIRSKGVRIPVDSVRRASKLRLALTNLDDLGSLPAGPALRGGRGGGRPGPPQSRGPSSGVFT